MGIKFEQNENLDLVVEEIATSSDAEPEAGTSNPLRVVLGDRLVMIVNGVNESPESSVEMRVVHGDRIVRTRTLQWGELFESVLDDEPDV